MTYEEALQEIGVAPGSSQEEIRRAYSRKTRTWNPAAAPDGLRRLREAFELLQAGTAAPSQGAAPPVAAPVPPPLPTAEPRLAAPAPHERKAPRIIVGPIENEPSSFRRITFLAGVAFLVIALWFWFSGYDGFDRPEEEPSTAPVVPSSRLTAGMPPSVDGPGEVSFASGAEALQQLCAPMPRAGKKRQICLLSQKLVAATTQHKCSDAEIYRKALDAEWYNPTGQKKDPALQNTLDAEIERCWKFWNP